MLSRDFKSKHFFSFNIIRSERKLLIFFNGVGTYFLRILMMKTQNKTFYKQKLISVRVFISSAPNARFIRTNPDKNENTRSIPCISVKWCNFKLCKELLRCKPTHNQIDDLKRAQEILSRVKLFKSQMYHWYGITDIELKIEIKY